MFKSEYCLQGVLWLILAKLSQINGDSYLISLPIAIVALTAIILAVFKD